MNFTLVRNAVGAPPAGGSGGLSALVGAHDRSRQQHHDSAQSITR